ncbi:Pyrophosphate-dependent fructose 6-phosphate-1-kinase (EC [Olavius algarvensis Delta 1 endosymbiont]|nr:Pyrophosphate-dependent fructose 6-phosphate-1-kinase (EC [Olavius algarvensis Delta 1 endosymbiont]
MPEKKAIDLEDILNHPQVRKVTDDVNPEIFERRNYAPPKCEVFSNVYTVLAETDRYRFELDKEAEKQLPDIINNRVQLIKGRDSVDDALARQYGKARNIGIVFSGGPSPGGHNVIAGLYDAAKKVNPATKVLGFLVGPDGIIENEAVELNDELVDRYRNLGGFTMIKTGRTKIDTGEKMALSRQTCRDLKLDALVVVGGDDSNTNAAFLAQELLADGVQIIGVPKTIDGDIQVRDADGNVLCAMSFGFHTAARAFAGSVSNLCTDSSSDIKYWHICKVMGRVASHLALEVALQTHANMTLIGEDLADYVDQERLRKAEQDQSIDYHAYGMTLRHLSRIICEGIVRRAAAGKNYGVIVIPEGVLEFVNEIQVFILKLNTIIADFNQTHDQDFHSYFPRLDDKLEYLRRLAQRSREDADFKLWNTRDDDLFNDIPAFFQKGLLMERDSHGNFPFSQVETEKVLLGLVQDYLNILKEEGTYKTGIDKDYFSKTIGAEGLDPDRYGPALFKNYGAADLLLVKPGIISIKTLRHALRNDGLIAAGGPLPAAIEKIFKKSMADFKTQIHFYGYDGRGNDPTRFDCNYTYNLGLTVFSLIANGATGQMAAIKNLDMDFSRWEPIGIPIAPLMHLEERKSKLALVIEKSIVDVKSIAFQVVKAYREKWLAAEPGDDHYRRPGPIRFAGQSEEERPITLELNAVAKSLADIVAE